MKRNTKQLFGCAISLAILIPSSISAALVEYRGSRNMLLNGVEQNVTLSLTIDDEFQGGATTVQYMYDNYPSTAAIDHYYGYFNIDNVELAIEGSAPKTNNSGEMYIWVSDLGATGYDLEALRLLTEDMDTDWGGHSRIEFLDQSSEPYDWAAWWGYSPTNALPPLMSVSELDLTYSGFTDEFNGANFDGMILSPVPIPAAVWLFAPGLIGFLSAARRKKPISL
jgi:hypothetical protein